MIESYKEVCSKQTPHCAFLEKGSRTVDLFVSEREIEILKKTDYLVFHVHSKKFAYGKMIILVSSAVRWVLMDDILKEEIIKAFAAESEVLPLLVTEDQLFELQNKKPFTIRFRCLKEHYNLICYLSKIEMEII